MRDGFIEAGFEDAAFEVVGNQEVGTAPKYVKARVWAPIQSGLGQRPRATARVGWGFRRSGVSDKESVGNRRFVTALWDCADKVAAGASRCSSTKAVEIAVGMRLYSIQSWLSQVQPFVVLHS
ncbi:MAG: hypothetical protein IPN19_00285 [Elusimicrobia bacterium]|nr:hypothetical protein [Elusimicrobiota bacterium]